MEINSNSSQELSGAHFAGKVNLSSLSAASSKEMQEAFAELRSNLLFCGKEIKTVLVSSCETGDGKSTVAVGLAENLARLDKKVLLVDSDLRKSSMFGRPIKNKSISGFSELISGQAAEDEVVYNTHIPTMDVIFSGARPSDAPDLLSGEGLSNTIALLREQYDYVIFDSSSAREFIDSTIISASCDGVILVVSKGKININRANKIKERFEKSGSRFLGVVLNNNRAKTVI